MGCVSTVCKPFAAVVPRVSARNRPYSRWGACFCTAADWTGAWLVLRWFCAGSREPCLKYIERKTPAEDRSRARRRKAGQV